MTSCLNRSHNSIILLLKANAIVTVMHVDVKPKLCAIDYAWNAIIIYMACIYIQCKNIHYHVLCCIVIIFCVHQI